MDKVQKYNSFRTFSWQALELRLYGFWAFMYFGSINMFGKVKVKVKVSLCLTKHRAMKASWWSGGIAPGIL
jgi:hypothetical protein